MQSLNDKPENIIPYTKRSFTEIYHRQHLPLNETENINLLHDGVGMQNLTIKV